MAHRIASALTSQANEMIDPLDEFLAHYFHRRPVNATFTGEHRYDDCLPDWSEHGLAAGDDSMRRLLALLEDRYPAPSAASVYRENPDLLDAELMRAFCEIQLAENSSRHGPRGNPALWTGEAVFSVISLMIREFAPLPERAHSAIERMKAIPEFLNQAHTTMKERPLPLPWTAKAVRDCAGAQLLLGDGLERWVSAGSDALPDVARLRSAAVRAAEAFGSFADWLTGEASSPESAPPCGTTHYDLLLRRGHQCLQSRADLLADARKSLDAECCTLEAMAKEAAGSWAAVQEQLAADHPSANDYLATFEQEWRACRQTIVDADVVTWPDWPIVYREFPPFTRDAAPYLYYLYYRSPAPLDDRHHPERNEAPAPYVYVVPPLPDDPEPHLRAWNRSVIRLNHVLHHGGVGHHLQNWHAYYRAPTRIGQIAAVDCASRIGMFCGGTMAEGWACYATGLMGELGGLTPLELVSEQHSRVRQLARAVIDLSFHAGEMSFDEAVAFFTDRTGAQPSVAHAEVVKCSMFPCTPVMYWLGTQGIIDLRERLRTRDGANFSLKRFHDDLLGHGSIPVPLIARIMDGD